MKKLFSIVFALALVLTVLAGCQASLSAPQPPAEPPANVVPLDAPAQPLPPAPPAERPKAPRGSKKQAESAAAEEVAKDKLGLVYEGEIIFKEQD